MSPLENGSIHVLHTDLDTHNKHYALFQSWLSTEEKTRAKKLKLPYRQRFILTRGLLRHLLSGYSEQPPEKILFSYTELGKPLFINPSRSKSIEFNLSHSREKVVFAFTMDTPIGIDLEYKVQRKHIDKVAYRFFSAHDYEQLAYLTGEEKLNAFFNTWVRNEALLKAQGYHLQTHPFSKYKNTKSSALITSQQLGFRQASLFTLALHPNFAAAIAIKGNSKPIIVKEFDYLNSINIKRTTPQTASSACISVKG